MWSLLVYKRSLTSCSCLVLKLRERSTRLKVLCRKQKPTPMSGLGNTKQNWRKSVPSFRRGSLNWRQVHLLQLVPVHSFEQTPQIALQKATSRAAEADERSQRACEQIEQYEKELAEVHTELDAKKSELETVRLRPMDTENGWAMSKSKAEAETSTLHAPTAKSPNNMEEDQITRRLMERMQAMEAEIASLRGSEKSFDMMECRNEG